IGGLVSGQAYYVVRVDKDHIRLVENLSDVANAKPIHLTSTGNGNKHQLGTTVQIAGQSGIVSLPPTDGIGVQAILNSDVRSKAKPEVGGKFNISKYKDIFTKGDIGLAAFLGTNASAASGKGPNGDIKNDTLSGAGGVAVNIVHNTVTAAIGQSAIGRGPTAANPTHVQSDQNVEVIAQASQKAQLLAQSDVSKPKSQTGPSTSNLAVGLSLGLGLYQNDVLATVGGNAAVDAAETVKVDASLTYPFLIKPADIILGIPQDMNDRGVSGLTDLLDGTFGVSSKFMTTWVVA